MLKYFILGLFIFQMAWSIPAKPGVHQLVQPNGTTFQAQVKGDEWQHWVETLDGYTIDRTPSGEWQYVADYDDQNQPHFTGNRAELSPPPGLVPHIKPTPMLNKPDYRDRGIRLSNVRTNFQLPLLLIEYPNLLHAYPPAQFDSLMNQIGYTGGHGQTGSFRDYYLENSYGAFDPHSVVYGWFMAESNYEVYGSDAPNGWNLVRQMIAEAVDSAEAAGVDWSVYDNDGDGYVDDLNIIHAGGGAEEGNGNYIWSHSWSLGDYARTYDGVIINHYTINPELQGGTNPGMVNIGVLCHEFGHALGLPDLYDTDYSSSGIGIWGLMASGSWGGNNNSPWYPSHLSAWSKKTLGWITPTEVTQSIDTITFPPNEVEPFVVKIAGDSPEWEYFLLENRQNFGFDTTLRATGLLIWHIDESQWGNTEDFHYLVDLEQADGLYELNYGTSSGDPGDPFPGTHNNTRLSFDTTPNSRYYDNSASGVSVVDITTMGDSMRATIRNIPTLTLDHVDLTNDLGDGDGIFNPGESVVMVFTLMNPSSTPITNLTATINVISPGITLSDTTINFGDLDAFGTIDNASQPIVVTSDSNLALGNVYLDFSLVGIVDSSAFDQLLSVPLTLRLDQAGFPVIMDRELIAAPTVVDLDQDGEMDILVAQYDGQVKALNMDGTLKAGQWPFDAENQVWNAPAVADINQDGSLEIVFTSKNKHLYVLQSDGGILTDVNIDEYLVANPALGNLDDDPDLEIVFGSVVSDGKLYALNPDGSPLPGFPVSLNDKVYNGAALADFDQDGYDDMVVATNGGTLIRINSDGQIASGFPVNFAGASFRSAPVVVEGQDGGFVILAIDRYGKLVAINERGEVRFTVDTGISTYTSLSLKETENSVWIIWGDINGTVYGYTLDGASAPGFPLTGSSIISGTPVFADLDGAGAPTVIFASTDGKLTAQVPGASLADPFPITLDDGLTSSPVVTDLDQDGDLEILVGGQSSLQVLDIKTPGSLFSNGWSMDRGNLRRTGRLETPLFLDLDPVTELPLSFGLNRIYPNPFNPTATIQYSLDQKADTRLAIYNLLGQEVITLWSGVAVPGEYTVQWQGENAGGEPVSGGIYLVRLISGNQQVGQKILFLK